MPKDVVTEEVNMRSDQGLGQPCEPEETTSAPRQRRRPWWHLVSTQHSLPSSSSSSSSSSSTNYLHTSLCPSRRSRAAAATTAPDIHPISSASHPMMIRPPHSICTPPAQAPPPKQPLCASFKSLHLLVSSPRKPPPPRSRPCLRFQPSNHKLYFPYEPGKQSTSAVRIMNVSRSAIAFKFQTTSPKSCFMRPPNGVLSSGESIVASVVKFIELPNALKEAPQVVQKRTTRDKFKILSLKIEKGVEFTPDLFDEHKELVAVEQILQVVLLNPSHHCRESIQLKSLLAEADVAQDSRKQFEAQQPNGMRNINDINILEEWRQRKLAREKAK